MTSEVDQLFNNLRRGNFTEGGSPGDVFGQAGSAPLLPGDVLPDLYQSPSNAMRSTTGLDNHNFREAPADPSVQIDDIHNKLPGWTTNGVAAGSIGSPVYAIADAASGSGYVIRVSRGATLAYTYIDQISTIASSRALSWTISPVATFTNRSANTATIEIFLFSEFLKSDGVTLTGTSNTTSVSLATMGAGTYDLQGRPNGTMVVPSDAQFIHVRAGIQAGAGATNFTTGSADLTEVRLQVGSSTAVAVTDGTAPGTYGPGEMYETNGALIVAANQGGVSGATPYLELDGATGAAWLIASSAGVDKSLVRIDGGNNGNINLVPAGSGSIIVEATAKLKAGSGTPEGNVTAPVGSIYLRTNGGAGTTFYVKESGSGNTGWVGK